MNSINCKSDNVIKMFELKKKGCRFSYNIYHII